MLIATERQNTATLVLVLEKSLKLKNGPERFAKKIEYIFFFS